MRNRDVDMLYLGRRFTLASRCWSIRGGWGFLSEDVRARGVPREPQNSGRKLWRRRENQADVFADQVLVIIDRGVMQRWEVSQ